MARWHLGPSPAKLTKVARDLQSTARLRLGSPQLPATLAALAAFALKEPAWFKQRCTAALDFVVDDVLPVLAAPEPKKGANVVPPTVAVQALTVRAVRSPRPPCCPRCRARAHCAVV